MADIQKQISDLSPWNHLYEFDGIKTRKDIDSPGCNIRKWKRLEDVFNKCSIKNKSVIDVGCSDGYFSIKMKEFGAEKVLGIDPDEKRIKNANFAKDFFDLDRVEFLPVDIYDLFYDQVKYDVSVALGFLHRIPDIYKALETLCRISDTVVLEYKTLRDERPVCLWGGGQVKHNKLNQLYFIPSISFVKGVMSDFGFQSIYIDLDKSKLNYKRTIQVFSKK
jgi:predicted RNA methylase